MCAATYTPDPKPGETTPPAPIAGVFNTNTSQFSPLDPAIMPFEDSRGTVATADNQMHGQMLKGPSPNLPYTWV